METMSYYNHRSMTKNMVSMVTRHKLHKASTGRYVCITCLRCQMEGLSWQQPLAVQARADWKQVSSVVAVPPGNRLAGGRALAQAWAGTSAEAGIRPWIPWQLALGRPPAGVVCCSPGARMPLGASTRGIAESQSKLGSVLPARQSGGAGAGGGTCSGDGCRSPWWSPCTRWRCSHSRQRWCGRL